MALRLDVTKDDHVFLGEDKFLDLIIFTDHTKTVILDTSPMDLVWNLRKKDNSPDPPLIEKSTAESPPTITHTGVFNADPTINTLKVRIALYRADSYDPTVSPPHVLLPKKYRHSVKRIDTGSRTVLAFGAFQFLQATTTPS